MLGIFKSFLLKFSLTSRGTSSSPLLYTANTIFFRDFSLNSVPGFNSLATTSLKGVFSGSVLFPEEKKKKTKTIYSHYSEEGARFISIFPSIGKKLLVSRQNGHQLLICIKKVKSACSLHKKMFRQSSCKVFNFFSFLTSFKCLVLQDITCAYSEHPL